MGKRANCAKNRWTELNVFMTSLLFVQGVAFWRVAMIAHALKFLVALIF